MGAPLRSVPPGFDDLSIEDQIEYVNALWEHIARRQQTVTSPAWHGDVVRERAADYRGNPNAAIPWSAARDQLERKK